MRGFHDPNPEFFFNVHSREGFPKDPAPFCNSASLCPFWGGVSSCDPFRW